MIAVSASSVSSGMVRMPFIVEPLILSMLFSKGPHPHGAVLPAGGQGAPIGADRESEHRVLVAGEGADWPAGREIPAGDYAVPGAGEHLRPGGRGRHDVDAQRGEDTPGFRGGAIPEAHAAVGGAGEDIPPIGAGRHAGDDPGMAGVGMERRAGGEVPAPNRMIP